MLKENISIIMGDITQQSTDFIVNAANSSLLGGGGVDGAIHQAAGEELLKECRSIGSCPTGEARLTKGYNLKAKKIIHTVGPIWKNGNFNESLELYSCYKNSLQLCFDTEIDTKTMKSISFPCISTGIYGFPKELATEIAIDAVKNFPHELQVIFCCFAQYDFNLYNKYIN